MTTSVKSKPVDPAPSPAKVIFQGRIALDRIDVREQIRKKFDENAHKELTESVRTKDVISPITLRPKGERYELVAGERRYRAAKAAGMPTIPAIVRELDDQGAALYQVEENIHRKDLTPIEEARGFELLFKAKKFTVEQLAQLIDKSIPYVYRAIRLLDLSKDVLDAIECGHITPAHGHQLLRVTREKRTELENFALQLNWQKQYPSAKELMERVDRNCSYDLADAVFPKNVEYAGAIACTGCQYNTGNQGKLFDGAEEGGCTNRPCFDKKTEAAWAIKAETLKKRFPDTPIVFHDYQVFSGMTIHGATVKAKLAATVKNLKPDQAVVVSKENGDTFLAYRMKPAKSKPAAAAPKGQSDKERAIENAVAEHLEALQNKLIVEATDKQIAAVMTEEWQGWRISELKKAGFKTLTPTNILRAFWRVETKNGVGVTRENLIPMLGGDFKKEKAIATKAAEEAWAKKGSAK